MVKNLKIPPPKKIKSKIIILRESSNPRELKVSRGRARVERNRVDYSIKPGEFEMQKGNRDIYHSNVYTYTFPSCRENKDSRVYIGGEFDDEISGECRATDAEHKSLGDKGSRKPS